MSHLALMLFLCCLRLGSLQRVLVHAFWLWKLRWELCRSLILLFCSRRLKQKQLRSVYPWAPQIEDQRIARRQCQMSEPSGGLAAQWDPLSDTIQLINVSHFTPFRCISPFNICKCAVFLCQLSGRATPTFTRMRWERRVMLDLIVISKKQVALVKIWNDLPHFPLTKKHHHWFASEIVSLQSLLNICFTCSMAHISCRARPSMYELHERRCPSRPTEKRILSGQLMSCCYLLLVAHVALLAELLGKFRIMIPHGNVAHA